MGPDQAVTHSQIDTPLTHMDLTERRLNNSIHFLGLSLSLPAVLFLIIHVGATGRGLATAAAVVYGAAVLATFRFSAAYHLVSHPVWRERIRACDHAAIFVMIAGTYTPFALFGVGGIMGWGLLVLVWLLAVVGVVLKLAWPRRWESASILFYLAMGWIGLPAVSVLIDTLSEPALALLGAGGVLYTVGVGFHVWERLRFQNVLWHCFVLVAAACHYVAIVGILT